MDIECDPAIRRSLERRLQKKESVNIDGTVLEVIDLHPETPKSDVPVLLAPGWAPSLKVFRENMLTLARLGRRVIAIDAPHGIPTERIEGLSDPEARKSAAILHVLQAKGIGKVDVIGHSEAGLYVTAAALQRPDQFRNIVLVDPAGIIGEDRLEKLSARFIGDITRQVRDAVWNLFRGDHRRTSRTLRALHEGGKPIRSSPRQSFKEVQVIASTQIQDRLRKLKEMGKGISVIHAVDDGAFPMPRVQGTITSQHTDGFYAMKGTHNEFFLDPIRTTELAEHALTSLERAKQVYEDQ